MSKGEVSDWRANQHTTEIKQLSRRVISYSGDSADEGAVIFENLRTMAPPLAP